MKYIKRFIESESNSEIIDDCKSLLLDLTDQGFDVEVRFTNKNNNEFCIDISKDKTSIARSFWAKEIGDYLKTISDYLSSNNYKYDVSIYSAPSFNGIFYSIDSFLNMNENIRSCDVYFTFK